MLQVTFSTKRFLRFSGRPLQLRYGVLPKLCTSWQELLSILHVQDLICLGGGSRSRVRREFWLYRYEWFQVSLPSWEILFQKSVGLLCTVLIGVIPLLWDFRFWEFPYEYLQTFWFWGQIFFWEFLTPHRFDYHYRGLMHGFLRSRMFLDDLLQSRIGWMGGPFHWLF